MRGDLLGAVVFGGCGLRVQKRQNTFFFNENEAHRLWRAIFKDDLWIKHVMVPIQFTDS